ncbi:hypothetical protein GH714_028196 [Hevea brasiliensis]|uniref:Uncharacterized protein n=1 Tax=Hevea brasiliensis TaxID=3981 RepID=A0A6A6MEL8_HEVBR|nr:hypothetical protein GH714_028196 [Hevea brasiliensis]
MTCARATNYHILIVNHSTRNKYTEKLRNSSNHASFEADKACLARSITVVGSTATSLSILAGHTALAMSRMNFELFVKEKFDNNKTGGMKDIGGLKECQQVMVHHIEVLEGKKMPGRMGGNQITVKNVWVYKIHPARNLMWVRGQVPGAEGNFVFIKDAVYKKPDISSLPFPTYFAAEDEDT